MSEGQKSSPKRVLLTTIGTGPLSEVPYIIDEKITEKNSYFPYMLAKSLMPGLNTVFVLVTPEAKEKHWEKDEQYQPLQVSLKSLDPNLEAKGIDIPKGTNEEEIWEIFSKVYAKVDEGVDLYLDVTHGLRHLPMIMLAACMYLRKAKKVKIQGIYYGALDAKPRESEDPRPALNLLPFVVVLDWAEGLSAFQRTGDVSLFAQILSHKYPANLRKLTPVKQLKSIADMHPRMRDLSVALDLSRPLDALYQAHSLQEVLQNAIQEVGEYRPVVDLFSQVQTETARYALNVKDAQERVTDPKVILVSQVHLIRWLRTQERLLSALITAREWFVSWVMFKNGASSTEIFEDHGFTFLMTGKRPRDVTENAISAPNQELLSNDVFELWKQIRDLRNDLAHVGYRKDPEKLKTIQKNIADCLDKLFGNDTKPGRLDLETLNIKPDPKKQEKKDDQAQPSTPETPSTPSQGKDSNES